MSTLFLFSAVGKTAPFLEKNEIRFTFNCSSLICHVLGFRRYRISAEGFDKDL